MTNAPDPKEILRLGATDMEFYGRQWFPRAFRMPPAKIHLEMWRKMEDPRNRYIAFKVPRDFAKTTIARVYASKRIAYGESKVMLIVGHTQPHAIRSVRWLKAKVDNETPWSKFFRLRKGQKWTDEWIELVHEVTGESIHVMAYGIYGGVRGVNVEDYRPDFILGDDLDDDDSPATDEQQIKLADRVMGAVRNSLAPPTDCPTAKFVIAQTATARGDLIQSLEKDSAWVTVSYSCFDENGKSNWEERYPTEFLLKEKQSYIDRDQLDVWLKEKEGKVVSKETSVFQLNWLKEYDLAIPPVPMVNYLWIDPVPPPSPKQLKKGLRTKDYECLAIVGRSGLNYYLREYRAKRGHDPDWTLAQFWELVYKYNPRMVGVETVAYQRTLQWLLQKSMKARQRFLQIFEPDKEDRRHKVYRITDSLSGIAQQGHFFISRHAHGEFVGQWIPYPNVPHDDIIESVANAARLAQNDIFDEDWYQEELESMNPLPKVRYAP